ncbi:10274_t:CDS:2 [Ambispora leptoticha]|uniref:10274_t:CDS:1 n=1 Tax=Ambispora leptoticha TaxID=144679 RepID=A0A9N9CUL1_9GLOM|nr:10274_t:CDS:2 [Ambispora leptoticha]
MQNILALSAASKKKSSWDLACKKTLADGPWTVSTTTAATVRSTVRRQHYQLIRI